MLFLRSLVLPLLLLLIPVIAASGSDHDRPITSCILNCLATYALDEQTFTCQTLKTNTALVDCIRKCPVHDIDNFSRQVLGLPADCEAQLYPGATGSITESATPTEDHSENKPTESSDEKGGQETERHNVNNCHQMRGDSMNSTRYTSWSGACTKTEDSTATVTGEATATNTGTTGTATGNITRTTTAGPHPTAADATAFGAPSVGFLVLGVVAWAFAL